MSKDHAAQYKIRKEAFVSNLSGSSLTEINLVTLVAASAVFLWTALQARHSLFTPYTPVALVADFLLNVCAILFAITLYSSSPLALTIFLITPGVVLLLLAKPPDGRAWKSKKPTGAQPGPRSAARVAIAAPTQPGSKRPALVVRPFLTHYRGSMLVVTCLAILAVDFPIFPRRYAKVETWGTSLMDLGVGSFVFSAGVVSARAVVRAESDDHHASHPQSQSPSQSGHARKNNNNFAARFVKALRHSVPLFILGLIRLYSVKGLDYAEHVSEYGVHWNFFFTLALLPPFVEISDTATRRVFKSSEVFALVLTTMYELVLDNTRLLSYILISPRGPDLLSKNREGVFSFAGYLAIFLCGRGVGVPLVRLNLQRIQKEQQQQHQHRSEMEIGAESTRRERISVLRDLILRAVAYAALYALSTNLYTFNLSVSRRLANLPYVLWVVAFNTAQLSLFGLVEAVGPAFSYTPPTLPDEDARQQDKKAAESENDGQRQDESAAARTPTPTQKAATSTILRAFNSNGLVTFLVANLLTGLVNLTFNTLDMPPARAMVLLIGYAVAVTGVALGLDMSGVKIKL
ncbi:hypothetical protein A1O7_02565 [Cladophialophora yegresii CBS 114405]|uniref:GPI-anchored wall transfer protein n=1 Tax=Cladophialophora yegresii CBS 114405 TaxID=1182544 RepID=W9W234_9EURO|nr:uncharacterized protein A1O7_02565 [Cladophialophora yegresii CBS 114405]EXJ62132.1 hypothetical protein A1O7_02565 [Cladophialophora yegresii CBS 114405]